MALIGYVRCSTNRQMVLQQIDALRAAGCLHIYKDRAVRATAKKRPGLLAVRKALKPGDTFVITSIDRAFRSTIDAIIFLDDITNLDIARASKIRANLPEIHFSRGINRVSIQNLL
ncbi:recombinase family protein, partial [Nitrosomonas sp. Nm166]|uniref:recombinase family protein n=1 Tax=Nitrosomonas sp. Nm166 TaxID=1881054 RepID=UPI0008EDED63